MERKYQVFISSTYEDLKDERKELIQALLEMDCIPSGMELFQACNTTQWHLIQNVISSCDFYIVIIAGRYGSVHPETGISFTQMEYDYACKMGIPVFAFLHQYPDKLPVYKVEKEKKLQKKLQDFKDKILKERLIKYWTNPYDLASSIKTSIFQAIKANPPGGWVRYKDVINNDKYNINTLEMFEQINELKKIILANYNDILENKKRKDDTNSSDLLKQLNEIKNIITSNDNKKHELNTPKNINTTQKYDCVYQIKSRETTLSLNSMHVSTLKEITNIIFSSGITGLSTFFDIPIKADFSRLQVCKNLNEAQKIIDNHNKYGMLSDFYTESRFIDGYTRVYGKIYLNFNIRIVEKITSLLSLHYSHYISNYEYEYLKSALYELSNIFIGASLTSLAEIINVSTQMSATIDNIDIKNINLFKNDDSIFISKFTNDINEPNLFDAYLILEPKYLKLLLEQTFGEPIM